MWQTALLALLQFGVFRAASAASVHDGPIFAFVAFDKVGSTSLRQILRTREKLHNHSDGATSAITSSPCGHTTARGAADSFPVPPPCPAC